MHGGNCTGDAMTSSEEDKRSRGAMLLGSRQALPRSWHAPGSRHPSTGSRVHAAMAAASEPPNSSVIEREPGEQIEDLQNEPPLTACLPFAFKARAARMKAVDPARAPAPPTLMRPAEAISRARSERDQREHVQAAVHHRRPAALESGQRPSIRATRPRCDDAESWNRDSIRRSGTRHVSATIT
jgi:hypothetical protein